MATHVISRRIQYIIQSMHDSYFPSKQSMLDALKEKDFSVSARTLDRDLERIRTDFGLEILYDKSRNGYYIDEDNSVKVDSFFKFLEIVTIADVFSEHTRSSKKILKFVSFDDSKSFKGLNHLKTILMAISQCKDLDFVHENFTNKTNKDYQISPLLLKEYENRWYVIGVPKGMNEIRTFGIDRISQLFLGDESNLKRAQFEDQLKVFDTIIGLDYENKKPIKITLLINELHVNYLRSLPIHHSQVIHDVNNQGQLLVDFFLVPNYEFKTQVLKMGENALVVYPIEFKEEIKNMLKVTLDRYQ
jgi:predicted DNA-binding transcriptional regulator YafY